MRILHVVASTQRRGAEMFAADLIRALPGSAEQQVAVLRCAEDDGIDYQSPTTVLGVTGGEAFGFEPRALGRLCRLVRAWPPSVVLAHGGQALKYALGGAAPGRTAVLYRRIGSAHPRTIRGLRKVAYGTLIRRTSKVIAVAEAVRTETIRVFRVRKDHVVVIPNAVDISRLGAQRGREAARRFLGIPLQAEVVLSVGAFTWEKDPLVQVDIGAGVLRERPDAVFLMVGDGPLRPNVEAALRGSKLDGRIRLLGVRSDVGDLLAAADVVLLASQTEGMPGVLIEAGLAGVPAAAYRVGGVPEVVAHAQTGLLAPSGDVRALTTCVLDLLASAEMRRVMGRAAGERCRNRFDIRGITTRYIELFDEVFDSGKLAGERML